MLVWFAYFASIVDNFKVMLMGIAVLTVVGGVIALLILSNTDTDKGSKEKWEAFEIGVALKFFTGVGIVVTLLYALLPTTRDTYFVAGAWVAKEVATSAVAQKSTEEVRVWLSHELETYRNKNSKEKKAPAQQNKESK